MDVALQSEKKRSPTHEELIAYYETWTPTQIEAFRDRAQASLAAFGSSVVEDAKPEIFKEALQGRFWGDVWRAMFASFLYTLLLIAMVLVLRWAGVDFLELLEKAKPGAR